MPSILKSLRLAADPGRLRLLLLLEQEELSVAELQTIVGKPQSQGFDAFGAVETGRPAGRPTHRQERVPTSWTLPPDLVAILRQAAAEIPESCPGPRRPAPRAPQTAG